MNPFCKVPRSRRTTGVVADGVELSKPIGGENDNRFFKRVFKCMSFLYNLVLARFLMYDIYDFNHEKSTNFLNEYTFLHDKTLKID